MDQLQGQLNELTKDQDRLVICLSGYRSQSGRSQSEGAIYSGLDSRM
jgi:hypothetical protein